MNASVGAGKTVVRGIAPSAATKPSSISTSSSPKPLQNAPSRLDRPPGHRSSGLHWRHLDSGMAPDAQTRHRSDFVGQRRLIWQNTSCCDSDSSPIDKNTWW